MTASPASSRRARGRSIRTRRFSSAPATPSSAPAGGSKGPSCYRSRASRIRSQDLLGAPALVERHRNGIYVTLRLTSSMYHRFHAPHDCRVEQVIYISGDTWNVNPIALQRVEKLFCKNERAVIETRLAATGDILTLVPVAAILVASIRLHCLDVPLTSATAVQTSSLARPPIAKATRWDGSSTDRPSSCWRRRLCRWSSNVHTGTLIRQGQALMQLPPA